MVANDFETVKATIDLRDYAEDRLVKVGAKYACPYCGSGTKQHKTSAFLVEKTHFVCFSCGVRGDVFDLVGKMSGTDDKAEQLRLAAEYACIEVGKPDAGAAGCESQPLPPEGEVGAFQEALERSSEALAYLAARGIDADVARRFRIGYDVRRERITIPFPGSASYHIDRDITRTSPCKYVKPPQKTAGRQPLWNPAALEGEAFFVVEGPFDAIAVEQCGHAAVALCGTGGGALLDSLRSVGYKGRVLVALDNDEPGKTAQARLVGELRGAGFAAVSVGYPAWWPTDSTNSDASAQFASDRGSLAAWLREAAESTGDDEAPCVTALEPDAADAIPGLVDPLAVLEQLGSAEGCIEAIPTGLDALDEALDGGLRPALYILGALSSVGKTTFVLQMADRIAATGRQVLFVTAEMSSRELVAKSVARLMKEVAGVSSGAVEVLSMASKMGWGSAEQTALKDAIACYSDGVAPWLRFLEPEAQPSVVQIRETAESLAGEGGEPPVVVVDYIQLLAPVSPHLTDKQAVDANVLALRQLARDLGTPVVAVSSLNRGSYGASIAFDSFKESGGLEYGADVLLGLQPRNLGATRQARGEYEARKAAASAMEAYRAADTRDCELVVLKNRSGRVSRPGGGIPLRYEAVCGLFSEAKR